MIVSRDICVFTLVVYYSCRRCTCYTVRVVVFKLSHVHVVCDLLPCARPIRCTSEEPDERVLLYRLVEVYFVCHASPSPVMDLVHVQCCALEDKKRTHRHVLATAVFFVCDAIFSRSDLVLFLCRASEEAKRTHENVPPEPPEKVRKEVGASSSPTRRSVFFFLLFSPLTKRDRLPF